MLISKTGFRYSPNSAGMVLQHITNPNKREYIQIDVKPGGRILLDDGITKNVFIGEAPPEGISKAGLQPFIMHLNPGAGLELPFGWNLPYIGRFKTPSGTTGDGYDMDQDGKPDLITVQA